MKLRSVEVENFLGHEAERLDLPSDGIFVLTGVSGSGKSSLLIDAPGYALFGSVATRVRTRKQVALRHRDHPGQPVAVRVIYQFDDGEQLLFARGIDERDSTWAEVYRLDESGESELLASGSQEVARVVARKIGVDWKQFYASFVCRQDELTLLTKLRGQERKELVQQMLGMRELEQSAEILTKRLRRTNQELRSLDQAIGDYDGDSASDRLKELEARKEGLRLRLEEEETLLAQDNQRAKLLEDQLKAFEKNQKIKEELIALQAQQEPLAREIEDLAMRLEKQQEQKKLLSEKDNLIEEREVLSEQRDRLRKNYQSARNYQAAANRRQELLEEIDAIRTTNPILDGSARELLERRASLRATVKARISELDQRRSQLSTINDSGQCDVCLRPLEDDTALNHLNKHLSELEDIVKAAKDDLAPLDEAGDDLEKLANAQAALGEVEQSLSQNSSGNLEELQKQGIECSTQLESISQRLAEMKAIEEQLDGSLEDKLAARQKNLQEVEDKLGRLAIEEEGDFNQDELNQLMHDIGSRRGRIPELQREMKQAGDDLIFAEKEFAAVADKQQKRDEKRQQALDLEQLQTFLQGFQRKLAHDIRPALEEIGSEMLSQISGGRHVGMRIDDNYEIEVERAEGSLLPASLLSGGEQIRANLCLRLALTRLVSQRTGVPFRILVLDEPLPAQDPGHAERIMELLASLRPYYGQQFIISHVGDLSSADETDYLIEFDGGSGPNRVSLVYA